MTINLTSLLGQAQSQSNNCGCNSATRPQASGQALNSWAQANNAPAQASGSGQQTHQNIGGQGGFNAGGLLGAKADLLGGLLGGAAGSKGGCGSNAGNPLGFLMGNAAKSVHALAEKTIDAIGLQPAFAPIDAAIVHPLLWDPISAATGVDVSDHPEGIKDVGYDR